MDLVDEAKEAATLTGEATEKIRQAILDGTFEPNTRLSEVQLCEMLSISRTPMRAALQTLAAQGLLVYTANRGFTVRAFALSDIIDAYEMRGLAEGLAARRAAERGISDTDTRKMEEALFSLDEMLDGKTALSAVQQNYTTMNERFHVAVRCAADSQLIVDVVDRCRIPHVTPRDLVPLTLEDIKQRQALHHDIFDAILCRDAQRAEALMREHLYGVKLAMVRALARRLVRPDK